MAPSFDRRNSQSSLHILRSQEQQACLTTQLKAGNHILDEELPPHIHRQKTLSKSKNGSKMGIEARRNHINRGKLRASKQELRDSTNDSGLLNPKVVKAEKKAKSQLGKDHPSASGGGEPTQDPVAGIFN